MTLRITFEQFMETLRQVVADRGQDFVYPKCPTPTGTRCRYAPRTPGETPVRCLIGEIASRLGVSDQVLELWDTIGTVEMLQWNGEIQADEATTELMSLVQYRQDIGQPYGVVLEEAERLGKGRTQ